MLGTLIIVGGALYMGKQAYHVFENEEQTTTFRLWRRHKRTPLLAALQQTPRKSVRVMPPPGSLIAVSAATGLALAGNWLYPPLNLLSAGLTLYAVAPMLQGAYHALWVERAVDRTVLKSAVALGSLLTGQFIVIAVDTWFYYATQRVLRATEQSFHKAFQCLFEPQAQSVWIEQDGVEVAMSSDNLLTGDIIFVEAGEIMPVDGVITTGMAIILQLVASSGTKLARKTVGDPILASSLVLAGRIGVRVKQVGAQTTTYQIGQVLTQTAHYMPTLHRRGDAAKRENAWVSLTLGGLLTLAGEPAQGLSIVNLPLGYEADSLAAISMWSVLTRALHYGLLIQDGAALETLSQVDTIVLEAAIALRPETRHVITGLRVRGITYIVVITSEPIIAARVDAAGLDIDRIVHLRSPTQRTALYEQWRSEGRIVCTVGESTDDDPVASGADLKIAMQPLSAAVTNAAVVLFADDLQALNRLLDLAVDFAATTRTAFNTMFVPSVVNGGGALFFGFGLVTSVLLDYARTWLALGQVLSPLIVPLRGRRVNYIVRQLLIADPA